MTNEDALVNEAFNLLRTISFVTPAIALLLTLINPRKEGREHIDTVLFPKVLQSFICLVFAGIVNVIFLITPIGFLLVAVKILFLLGMIILLYATSRFLIWITWHR